MIRQALEYLGELAGKATRERPATLQLAGREFLYDDAASSYGPIVKPDSWVYLAEPAVLDLTSMIAWCSTSINGDGEIHLSRRGNSAAMTPRRLNSDPAAAAVIGAPVRRDKCSKGFFADYLPPSGEMSYIRFRDWIDTLGAGLSGRDDIEGALAAISAVASDTNTVSMSGATINVTHAGAAGLKTKGTLPRLISATIPFGDPDCETPVTFRLSAVGDSSGLRFRAEHHADDRALDRWLTWAKARLAEELPDWPVYVVP